VDPPGLGCRNRESEHAPPVLVRFQTPSPGNGGPAAYNVALAQAVVAGARTCLPCPLVPQRARRNVFATPHAALVISAAGLRRPKKRGPKGYTLLHPRTARSVLFSATTKLGCSSPCFVAGPVLPLPNSEGKRAPGVPPAKPKPVLLTQIRIELPRLRHRPSRCRRSGPMFRPTVAPRKNGADGKIGRGSGTFPHATAWGPDYRLGHRRKASDNAPPTGMRGFCGAVASINTWERCGQMKTDVSGPRPVSGALHVEESERRPLPAAGSPFFRQIRCRTGGCELANESVGAKDYPERQRNTRTKEKLPEVSEDFGSLRSCKKTSEVLEDLSKSTVSGTRFDGRHSERAKNLKELLEED